MSDPTVHQIRLSVPLPKTVSDLGNGAARWVMNPSRWSVVSLRCACLSTFRFDGCAIHSMAWDPSRAVRTPPKRTAGLAEVFKRLFHVRRQLSMGGVDVL